MGIVEEIFQDFFGKLREDKEVPESIVTELMRLREKGETISEDKALKIVEKGCENVDADKETHNRSL
jgi:hypothetical protein